MTPFDQPRRDAATPGCARTAAAPQNPIDMRQKYIDALANPGPVRQYGATVPPSPPLGQPSVLDSFLGSHQADPAAPAGGGYRDQPFFATLNKLRGNTGVA